MTSVSKCASNSIPQQKNCGLKNLPSVAIKRNKPQTANEILVLIEFVCTVYSKLIV